MSTHEPPLDPPVSRPAAVEEFVDVEMVDEPEVPAPDVIPPPVIPPPVRVFAAEAIEEDVAIVDERSVPVKMWRGFAACLAWLFGLASLIGQATF